MRKALIYVFLLLAVTMYAQDSIPRGRVIPMKGAFLQQMQERDSVLIADQLLYGFDLKQVEEGTRLMFPELPQEQDPKLMYLSPWKLDTLKVTKRKEGPGRLFDLRGSVMIASFEEGLYELPQIAIGRVSANGDADTLVFEPMKLEVKTMPVDTATFQPHDIKDQIRYPVTFAEVLPWLLGSLGAVGLIVLAVFLYRKYRRRNDPEFARRDPAHIIALRKLDKYRGNAMWAPEKQKSFYSGITDTLREYIDARYGISAMEMTTAEIFGEMKSADVPQALQNDVRELFERADFVKFAKFVASDDDNASALPVAVRFVTETYKTDVEADAPSMSDESGNSEKEVKDVL